MQNWYCLQWNPARLRQFVRNWGFGRRVCATLGTASLVLGVFSPVAWSQVTTYYGVSASLWTTTPTGNMKMDYDHVRGRFVLQYNYSTSTAPPVYGTIDLATKAFSHLAQTSGENYETLLTVLPNNWAGYSQGTTFVARGGGGEIYAIDPITGSYSTFATGLPSGGSGTHYTTVRWDSFGVANNDLFYANEGTGEVVRLNSFGVIVWQTTLMDGQQHARPEAMIVLGSNPRWGPLQNTLVIGQNSASTRFFVLDPSTGQVVLSLQSALGGSLESFRILPTGSWALYVSLYGKGIYQLTGLSSIPGLQPGDLFIARETSGGGEIWHAYWNTTTGGFVTQKIAEFNLSGAFLEDMVFAPVPEPSSLLCLVGLLIPTMRRLRRD